MTDDRQTRRSGEARAIVMLSLGQRDWADAAAATFARYATRCGADFHLERQAPRPDELPLPPLAARPGRVAKLAYACKLFFAWKHLAHGGYDRVLFVDDSCCIRPGAPDLFDLVPAGQCGFTATSARHAQESFEVIQRFLAATNRPAIDYDPADYANGGVILYDRSAAAALSPERICAAAELLYAQYPHQTLLYYLLKSGGVRLHRMPKSFNTIPVTRLPAAERFGLSDIRPFLDDAVFVYHITAGYRHRPALVKQISALFLADDS